MAQRDSLYLYLFIVAIVLFLGATFAFLMVYNQNETLATDVTTAKARAVAAESTVKKLSGDISALKEMIAGPNEASSIGDSEDDREKYLTETLAEIEKVVSEYKKMAGQSDSVTFTRLVDPYGEIKEILEDFERMRSDARDAERSAVEAEASHTSERDETIASLTQQLTEKQSELVNWQQQAEDCQNASNAQKEDHVRAVADLQDQMSQERVLCTREKGRLENQISILRKRLERYEEASRLEEEFAELEPDGRLFKVVPSLQKGWVDLGRVDHLASGLVFRVFQIIKGGKKIYKGRVEIRKVDENMAEVGILEEVDPLSNPITEGDYIASPLYDAAETPIFVFAGKDLESRDVTKEFVEAKLANYGVELRRDVDIDTTFVVALEGYDKSEQYGAAKELGVPILRESDVLEFIGY